MGEKLVAFIQTNINRYSLHCPICGRDILDDFLRDNEPCVHVVYLYFEAVQHFAFLNEHYQLIFDAFNACLWFQIPVERLIKLQKRLPASILHLTLETNPSTVGALSGVMRIGFDFDVVKNDS